MRPLRFLAGAALGLALLLVPATDVLAAGPDVAHLNQSWSQSEEFCGVPVRAHRVRVDTFFYRDSGGRAGDTQTYEGTTRWTYEPTGRWVQNHFAGVFHATDVTWLPDGTVTLRYSWSGTRALWRTSDGPWQVRVAGTFVVEEHWDLHDLDNPDDDEFLGDRVVRDAGSSSPIDDAAFCALVAAYLIGA